MVMSEQEHLFFAGVGIMSRFCKENEILLPTIKRILPDDRLYGVRTCGFYRPFTISVMVEKCGHKGHGGAAWSWPGYVIDRTPYGVIQHELGHHVDTVKTGEVTTLNYMEKLFSKQIYEQSKEPPLTGYLGTDKQAATFFMEWFAENFRLYVTNPGLCLALRPKFYFALFASGIYPLTFINWHSGLNAHNAPERIVNQARKKIEAA